MKSTGTNTRPWPKVCTINPLIPYAVELDLVSNRLSACLANRLWGA
jgi:hypothetical protein